MSETREPHDVVTLLDRLMSEGAEASVCAERDNVAAFVWIGESGLQVLAEELERQRALGNANLDQAAYALRDGSLVVVGQGARGAFGVQRARGRVGVVSAADVASGVALVSVSGGFSPFGAIAACTLANAAENRESNAPRV